MTRFTKYLDYSVHGWCVRDHLLGKVIATEMTKDEADSYIDDLWTQEQRDEEHAQAYNGEACLMNRWHSDNYFYNN